MKKVIIALLLLVGCLTFSKAQTNLNDFKYVIVPNSFEFLSYNDQFQLNSLTKFLFNKYGFNALMNKEEHPLDLVSNPCLSLKADVKKLKGFLKTKLEVVLMNCKNEIIFTTKVGETREKEYKKAYNFALRAAFKSFETVSYNYEPNDNVVVKNSKPKTATKQEIEKLKEKIKPLKEKESSKAEVETKIEDEKVKTENEVEQIAETVAPKQEFKKVKISNILYAQEIENGFQVVDSTPKVVMILLTTHQKDAFIVKGRDAIVYKEDGFWYLLENNGTTITTNTLNIKF
jgi:hypothetical protein